MKPLTFQAWTRNDLITITGYPTSTPGLAVHYPYVPCVDHGTERCWVVSHVRAGLKFPFCWDSPEAALAFADYAAQFGTWTITGTELARRMALPYVRRAVTTRAYALGARPRVNMLGDPHAIDNGAAV